MTLVNWQRFSFAVIVGILFIVSNFSANADDLTDTDTNAEPNLPFANTLSSMNSEQSSRVLKPINDFKELKSNLQSQIDHLQGEILDLFKQPLPDKNTILAKRDQMNDLQRQLDEAQLKLMLAVRNAFDLKQQQDLIYGDPTTPYHKANLTEEEIQQLKTLQKSYFESSLEQSNQLAQLQLDKALLLKRIDVDEEAVLNKQNEINKLQADVNTEAVKLELKQRNILTEAQREKLYSTHRADLFRACGTNTAEDDKLMDMHMLIEGIDRQGKRQALKLQGELLRLELTPGANEEELLAKCDEIARIKGEAAKKEVEYIYQIRETLTPAQRQKLVDLLQAERELKDKETN